MTNIISALVKPPDWYMMQEYIGPVDVDKELFERRRYKGDMVEMPSNWEYVE